MAKPSFPRKVSALHQMVATGLACWLALAGAFIHVRPVQAATLTITPSGSTLPVVVGENWSQVYSVSGGTAPYACSMSGTIPGLSFNASTLTLSGSPDDFGLYPVTISCTDKADPKNEGTYVLDFLAEAPTQTTLLTLRSDYPGGTYVAGYPIWVRADVSFNPAITGKQPTGTIEVSSGAGGPTCSDTLDANGEGECALIFPAAGSKTIQINFSGDTGMLPSTASSAPITILPLDAPPLLSAGRHQTCYLNPEGVMTCWGLGDAFAPLVEGGPSLPQGTYTKISAGGFQTCGLLVDGTIACWGENTEVTQSIPAGKFVDISAGEEHVCAIDTVNKLHCWGSTPYTQSVVPQIRVTAVSAGTDYDCAIRKNNSQPICWGTNAPSPAGNPTIKAVAVGNTHTCAIKTDGTLTCWGLPAMTWPSGTYQAIDSGSDYSCAQKTDGTIACWGSTAPAVATTIPYTRFTSGFLHTCALQPSGQTHAVACWGNNAYGKAPQITLAPTSLPQYLRNGVDFSQAFTASGGNAPFTISVSAGSSLPAGLVLANGTISGTPATPGVYSFSLSAAETFAGSSLPLQLSPGRQVYTTTVYSPATTTALALDLATVNAGSPVKATVTVTKGALGPALSGEVVVTSTDGDATCRAAVDASGKAECTLYFSTPGSKTVKADYLANDDYSGSASNQILVNVNPVVIAPAIAAGDRFSCSIDSSGRLACWGKDSNGQSTPPATGVYDQLDLGMSHACAVGLNRQVTCWGWNGPNNLILPPLIFGVVRVTTGNNHSCMLTNYGLVRCWGDTSLNSVRLQVPYPFSYDYAKVDAGADHTCAITKTGAIRCWGLNTSGQITAPTTSTFTDISAGGDLSCALNAAGTPTCWGSLATAPAGPFASLSAGKDFACGLKSDGSVTCWGGRSDTLAGPFSQISAGSDHVCGLLQTGRMQCWGSNAEGQAPVIAITPASLPTIDAGAPWNTQIHAAVAGGHERTGQYAYSISTGALPAGLNLNSSDGKISGTPTQSGVFSFTVRAQEANLDPAIVAEKSYTLTVRGWVDAAIESAQPAGAMVGRPIEVNFSVHARPGYEMVGEPTGVVTVTAEDNRCEVTLTNGVGSCLMVFVTPGAKAITIDYPGDALYLPGQPASAFGYTVTAFSQSPQIYTGLDRTLVHKADGTVGCLGGTCGLDQLDAVFTRVGVGDKFACGLQYEKDAEYTVRGEVACAVDDDASMMSFNNAPYIDLAVGDTHACALKIDGTVECQGDAAGGKTSPPAGSFASLSTGGGHTCALAEDGTAACWGAIASPPAGSFTQLTSGDAHTCGLKNDGSVTCWGDDTVGQSTVPASPTTFTQIAAGGNQTCGLDAEGHAACWGDNTAGQAEPAYGHYIAIDTDDDHTCALRTGLGVTCWGNDGLTAPGAPQFSISQMTETEIPALAEFIHDFDVTGGSEPLNAGVFAGRLPDGMCVGAECGPGTNVEPQPGFTPQDLSPAGLRLSGTPTLPGEYEFAIRWVDDSDYPLVMEQPYWLTVTGGDLAVTLIPNSSAAALEGMAYGFKAEVTNHTALPVPGVVLTFNLPAGLTNIAGFDSACTLSDSALTCPLGTVNPAELKTVEVTSTVTLRSGETLTVRAEVETGQTGWPEIHSADNADHLTVPVTAKTEIFEDDFDGLLSPEWTGGWINYSNGHTFLAVQSHDSLSFTLASLPAYRNARVSFDLHLIGEWQGGDSGGDPHQWSFSVDGNTLLDTSFSNDPEACQAYPGTLPECKFAGRTGAAAINELDISPKGGLLADSRYHLSFRIPYNGDVIEMLFRAQNLTGVTLWGIDNFVLELDNGESKVYLPMIITTK